MSDIRYQIPEADLLKIGLQVLEKIGDDYDITQVSLCYLLGKYLIVDKNILSLPEIIVESCRFL